MRKIEHRICDKLKEAILEAQATNRPVPKVYKLSERDSVHIFSDGTVGYKLWNTFIVKIDTHAGTVTTGSSLYWRSRTTNSRKRALQQAFGFPALDESTMFDYIRDPSKLSQEVESAIISSTTLVLSPSTKSTGGYLYVGLCDGSPPAGKNVKARLAHVDEDVPADKFGGYINLYFEDGVFDFGNRTHKTRAGAERKADADRPVHQFAVIIGEQNVNI